jgi:histidinol-phosphatase (PHP family)
MGEYVRSGIERGLEEIGFLAHAEAGIESARRLWLNDQDLDDYWEEGRGLREQYGDRIRVTVGLELGLNPDALPVMKSIAERHPWDRIGLSYHQLPDGGSRLNICSRRSIPRLMEVDSLEMTIRYYADLRDHIAVIRPEFVCHLDVVRKFMADRSDSPEVRSLISEVLEEMRRNNVMLEVNTAGYDTVGAPYPAPWIIREAVEMGLGLVLSSDSHRPQDVARRFDEALVYIRRSLNGRA